MTPDTLTRERLQFLEDNTDGPPAALRMAEAVMRAPGFQHLSHDEQADIRTWWLRAKLSR